MPPHPQGFKLTPFTPAHIPETAELLFTAKLGLTINRLLFKNWPNETVQRQHYTAVLEDTSASGIESLSVVDEVSGQVLGHLSITWRKPAGLESEDPKEESERKIRGELSEVPAFFDPEVLAAVQAAVVELGKGLEELDHLAITYIIVHPSHRGRGIGTALMNYVFEKAKALGIPITISSEPQVHKFFKKHGFQDTKRNVDFELEKWAPPFSGFGTFRLAGMIWYP
ncbi:acyl-CoA N-acyltransferase [Aspergillus heterothallicus]